MKSVKDKMISYVYNPIGVQRTVLEFMEQSLNGKDIMNDPTNPFMMLMEAAATASTNATIEATAILKKKYPSLASSTDDLFHHLTDSDLTAIFATPGATELTFYVNALDIKMQGHRPVDAKYTEITIPSRTQITVLGKPLTLLNSIVIKLYDNNNVFVEQLQSDLDIAYADIGVLPSMLTTDISGVTWVTFNVPVKQVKLTKISTAITSTAGGFKQLMSLDGGKYCFAKVSYKDNSTNGQYRTLSKTHSDEYIDPTKPTVFIKLYEDNILFKIPDVYLISGAVSGSVEIELYTTEGDLYLPLDITTPDNFHIELGDTTQSLSAAKAPNVIMMVASKNVISGGRNNIDIDNMRESIIYNATGDIDLPITEYQIKQMGVLAGYDVTKVTDILTDRHYMALKNIERFDTDAITANQDCYINTIQLELGKYLGNQQIISGTNEFTIKSGSIFKEKNGILTLLTNEELETLNNLDKDAKKDYYKAHRLLYTPYYYYVNQQTDYSDSRIYDLDSPTINALAIIRKNEFSKVNCNIHKYTIHKTKRGYTLYFTIIGNDDFKAIDPNEIKIKAFIDIKGLNLSASFISTYDPGLSVWKIDLHSNLFIDEDNWLDLQNGDASIQNKQFYIKSNMRLYTYVDGDAYGDRNNGLQDEASITTGTILTKEVIDVTFGERLSYLWNKVYNVYNERKYQKRDTGLFLTYEENEYEINPDTGTYFTPGTSGEAPRIYGIKHRKGDVVKDSGGSPVYKYKQGDIVLDVKGDPKIDTDNGIVRYIDILMLDYIFLVPQTDIYNNYVEMIKKNLNKYLLFELPEMNRKMLDNTIIYYRPYRSARSVTVNIGNVYYNVDYLIKPSITLYMVDKVPLTKSTLNEYRNIIGKIIDNHLISREIKLSDLRKEILASLGKSIGSVKISGLDSNDSEIISIKDNYNRLTLNKVLDLDPDGNLTVRYDVNITAQY